jgi:hypothetical protein
VYLAIAAQVDNQPSAGGLKWLPAGLARRVAFLHVKFNQQIPHGTSLYISPVNP